MAGALMRERTRERGRETNDAGMSFRGDGPAADVDVVTQRRAITMVMAGTTPQPLNVSERRRLAAHEHA